MTRSVGLASVLLYILTLAFPISPRFALILLMAGGFLLVMPNTARTWPRSPLLLGVLAAFTAVSLLSALGATDVHHGLVVCLSLGPALLLLYLLSTRFDQCDTRWLAAALVVTAVALALYLIGVALVNWTDGRERWLALAGYTQLAVPNDLLLLALLAPYGTAIALSATDRAAVLGATLAVLLSLGIIVMFQSRGGLLAIVIAIVATVGLVRPRQVLRAAALILVTAVAIDAVSGFSLSGRFAGAWGGRIPLWLAAWSMTLDAPLLGHGPGAFSVVGAEYVAAAYRPDWAAYDPRQAPWAHNLYLELLAERGLLGAATFLSYLAISGRCAWLAYRRTNDAAARGLAAASLAVILAVLFAGAFELSVIRYWFVVLIAAVGGMSLVLAGPTESMTTRGKHK